MARRAASGEQQRAERRAINNNTAERINNNTEQINAQRERYLLATIGAF